jgi:RNA polymerase sigma-70 factor (ECF subfamily)
MMDERQSDENLVLKAKRGDADALNLLVERHYKRIYSLAFQMLGNAEDAADATQETFVKAFEQLRHFRGDASFSTWLHRIAINTCKDMMRRNRPSNSRN